MVMKKMVRLYTIPECGYCSEMKKELDKRGIGYDEVDISLEKNKDEFDEVEKISKTNSVPILIINDYLLAPEVNFWTVDEGIKNVEYIINQN